MISNTEFSGAWDLATRFAGRSAGAYGCGRAYVVLTGLKRADRAKVKMWCALNRKIWTGIDGHVRDGIYIGYDNGTGIELGRAEAFAAELQRRGLPCYAEAMED